MIIDTDKIKIERILFHIAHIQAIDYKPDDANEKIYWYAIARHLEIIGETSKHISDLTKITHSSIPWFTIEHLRDLLNHGYYKMLLPNRTHDVKKTILDDINNLKEIVEPLKDDESVQPSLIKKSTEKQDDKTRSEKLKEENKKGLGGFRKAGLLLNLGQDNEQLKIEDLKIIKSRMRRPTFDLIFIQNELKFLQNTLNNQEIPEDILQPAIEHCLGLIGQSMKEMESYHSQFVKEAELSDCFNTIIETRDYLMHKPPESFDTVKAIGKESTQMLHSIDLAIKNLKSIMPTRKTQNNSQECSPTLLSDSTIEQETEENFLMAMDLSPTQENLDSWEYGYYSSDDDIIAQEVFKQDGVNTSIAETSSSFKNKIFTELRERTYTAKKL